LAVVAYVAGPLIVVIVVICFAVIVVDDPVQILSALFITEGQGIHQVSCIFQYQRALQMSTGGIILHTPTHMTALNMYVYWGALVPNSWALTICLYMQLEHAIPHGGSH
jgi:hypothetical protein